MNMRLGMRETCWDWGKEQHLYNTYLPIPASCSQKNSPREPAHTGSSWFPAGHGPAALHTCSADKLWGWEQETTPPATRHHHSSSSGSRKYGEKRGVSEILSSLRSRTLCQVGPESSRAYSCLEISLNISYSLFTQLLKLLLRARLGWQHLAVWVRAWPTL